MQLIRKWSVHFQGNISRLRLRWRLLNLRGRVAGKLRPGLGKLKLGGRNVLRLPPMTKKLNLEGRDERETTAHNGKS